MNFNRLRKLNGEVPSTYNGTGAGAIALGVGALASSLISTGGAVYSYKKQEEAMDKAEEDRLRAEAEAEAEARRIFEATKPTEPTAKIDFGVDEEEGLGFSEFITPKSSNKAKTLGSPYTSTLGFGS